MDKKEYIQNFAKTFRELYWEGEKRVLLDRTRSFAGDDDFILQVVCDFDTAMSEASTNENVGLRHPFTEETLNMRDSLQFAKAVYTEGKKRGRASVFAIFSTPVNESATFASDPEKADDAIRACSLWVDE